MPVYEFCCKKCKNRFEDLIFKKSELDTIICPKCGSKDVEQLFLSLVFVVKGQMAKRSVLPVLALGVNARVVRDANNIGG